LDGAAFIAAESEAKVAAAMDKARADSVEM
jgi:hypothetical protein